MFIQRGQAAWAGSVGRQRGQAGRSSGQVVHCPGTNGTMQAAMLLLQSVAGESARAHEQVLTVTYAPTALSRPSTPGCALLLLSCSTSASFADEPVCPVCLLP